MDYVGTAVTEKVIRDEWVTPPTPVGKTRQETIGGTTRPPQSGGTSPKNTNTTGKSTMKTPNTTLKTGKKSECKYRKIGRQYRRICR